MSTPQANATFYDGATSGAWPVTLTREGQQLQVNGLAEARSYALAEVKLEPRLGSQPRRMALPGGAICESHDHDGIAAVFGQGDGLLHHLESRWRWVGYAALLLAGFGVAFYLWGLPLLASSATLMTPPVVERVIGDKAFEHLATLDLDLKPTALPAKRQAALRQRFAQLVPSDSRYQYRLHFRAAPTIGANAFALPGGVVVLTDELAAIVSDDEVIAVLAHEIGHVELRHGLRMIYQSTGMGVAVSAVLGDAPSAAAQVASFGALVLQLGYSRELESEADRYAQERLTALGQDRRKLGSALAKLMKAHKESELKVPALLSSHPDTAERIKTLSR
ncbi:M48 family metallopeptidase [Chitinolyticbacter albus]|uniref:M48 family metallopeptidase n=1 Tax=Chitinolyticbacter albus TaxID=2961951 RepID=UPI00210B6D12|nr:M48 family metallopeptidase [Chitinolyticbacter albus]